MNQNNNSLDERLEKLYSGAIYDVMREMGHHNKILPYNIRPLDPGQKLTGKIFTVEGKRDDSLDANETLLRWTDFLSKAPKGAVVVCQPNDNELSHMGELSAETLHFRGIKGYIVDGGCRDTDFLLKIGFKVSFKYYTPVDIVGKWSPVKFNQPIKIGDVDIKGDDYILADRDGTVVIPQEIAVQVIEKAEEVINTENLVRKAILEGVDPKEAYLTYGKF